MTADSTIVKVMTCIELADYMLGKPALAEQEAHLRRLGRLRVKVVLGSNTICIEYLGGQRFIEIQRDGG